MKNVTDLRNELAKLFTDVRGKKVNNDTAKTLVNTSNAIVKTIKIQLDHNRITNSKKRIPFAE